MLTLDMLGTARQIKVNKETTTIVDGAGDSDKIKARVATIRAANRNHHFYFDREKITRNALQNWLAALLSLRLARNRNRNERNEMAH